MSINLDQDAVDRATQAMCEAAQIPGAEGIPGEPMLLHGDMREQVIAFVLALNKNHEREKQYQGLWKKDTVDELGHQVAHKGKRLASTVMLNTPEIIDQVTDDALDAINYAAFVARKAHYTARDFNIVA